MRVDLALFDGDDLLDRKEITVSRFKRVDSFTLFRATHQLGHESADIVLGGFAEHLGLNKIALDMPIHESNDWESIDLGRYTLAFWCRLDA
ncbi:hypothetical protein GCM10027084_11250 [Pseudoxanthomonas sangjuensis]|nr:hypothetical protein CSC71_13020 [Pseudoxanthomonas sangjuensis]